MSKSNPPLAYRLRNPPDLMARLQGNADPDARVLLQMAELGSNLMKPHGLEFAFETATRPMAEAVAVELQSLGYAIDLFEPDEENPLYEVLAKRAMVPDLDAIMQLTVEFEALALRHGVSYEGWGSEIVE